MKLASQKLSLAVAATALLLAGCPHTPTRPNPGDTTPTASTGGNRNNDFLNTQNVPTDMQGPGTNLPLRDSEFDPNTGQNRSALQAQVVYFDFDRSDIKASERPKLQAAKEYLEKNPTHRLLLEGRCDWRGTAEYNLALGERRANAARAYLASIGVPATKMETISKGSLEASKNADAGAMAKDRRVDLVVLGPANKPPGL